MDRYREPEEPLETNGDQRARGEAPSDIVPGDPTAEAHLYWSHAFDFWNKALFGGELPKVMITLVQARAYKGFFRADAMENLSGATVHQIGMNPHFFHCGDADAHSTLVHEMVHHWREVLGPLNAKGGRGSRCYHDKVWAGRMEEVGLEPTDTGQPGGKRTGYRVTHIIVPHGPFDRAFRSIADDAGRIEWRDSIALADQQPVEGIEAELSDIGLGASDDGEASSVSPTKKKPKDRIKFSCDCGLNAWAKPSAQLICGVCEVPLMPDEGAA